MQQGLGIELQEHKIGLTNSRYPNVNHDGLTSTLWKFQIAISVRKYRYPLEKKGVATVNVKRCRSISIHVNVTGWFLLRMGTCRFPETRDFKKSAKLWLYNFLECVKLLQDVVRFGPIVSAESSTKKRTQNTKIAIKLNWKVSASPRSISEC